MFEMIDNEPICALSSTVALLLVLPASMVVVVNSVEAFVATKLKSVPADDAPLISTVPLALSDI